MEKPFSQACENNKQPILTVLQRWLTQPATVLEIGSGTGQHAVHFAANLPHLNWQTSDLPENHGAIHQWMNEAALANIQPPLTLDVAAEQWPIKNIDAIFTANTLHIMSWAHVQAFFSNLSKVLADDALLLVYGPFNYEGKYTSDSNARFDVWLKDQGSERGIRDFEAVNKLAEEAGLKLQEDNAMPANNRLLVWKKNTDQSINA